MTDVRFYHLQKQTLDQALPLIAEKAYQAGHRVVIRMSDAQEVERMNTVLWTYKADSFLPHGSKKNGHAEKQPIWVTHIDENPNEASVLILTQDVECDEIGDYKMCCDMLDGRSDSSVQAARKRWKKYQGQDHDVTYWFQNEKGGWEKKAA